ncbi:EF-hand domain-containing protein [Pararoseomonas indoligenes]|uniref:EF-hand domain-containing protein n=1 Tax=Roseomonas indoligenes TaxID=2820811 RepID=A0A940N1M5_9PROT|nr:EF-hand domain-containing protein [Pararoseomonas indoligenes]MBP0493580.1 EF-hand domain-containing protein [Pararoseomonas indoligenes]
MSRDRKTTFSALAIALGIGAMALPALAQPATPQPATPQPAAPEAAPMRPAAGPAQVIPMGRGAERMLQGADANRDGRVTEAEAWDALAARFAAADTNKDGGLTWDEFRSYAFAQAPRGANPARQERVERMEERAQSMFRAVDADRDGRVTTTELRPFAEALFRSRDLNGDTALTRDELRPGRASQTRAQ